jgi:hypothetical protein
MGRAFSIGSKTNRGRKARRLRPSDEACWCIDNAEHFCQRNCATYDLATRCQHTSVDPRGQLYEFEMDAAGLGSSPVAGFALVAVLCCHISDRDFHSALYRRWEQTHMLVSAAESLGFYSAISYRHFRGNLKRDGCVLERRQASVSLCCHLRLFCYELRCTL